MSEIEKISVTITGYYFQFAEAAKYLQIIFAEKERKEELSEIDFTTLHFLYDVIRSKLKSIGEDPGNLYCIFQSDEQPKSLIDI